MSDSKLMQWAVIIDFLILVVLSYDVYLTYQFHQSQVNGGSH
jgi:hypothetical protein